MHGGVHRYMVYMGVGGGSNVGKKKEIEWVWTEEGCSMLGRLSTSAKSLKEMGARLRNGGVGSGGFDC